MALRLDPHHWWARVLRSEVFWRAVLVVALLALLILLGPELGVYLDHSDLPR